MAEKVLWEKMAIASPCTSEIGATGLLVFGAGAGIAEKAEPWTQETAAPVSMRHFVCRPFMLQKM